eukprot:COSAG02_NODE_41629_length_392_cov_1.232082_1_plen_100_part_01
MRSLLAANAGTSRHLRKTIVRKVVGISAADAIALTLVRRLTPLRTVRHCHCGAHDIDHSQREKAATKEHAESCHSSVNITILQEADATTHACTQADPRLS